jgi:hypothetical protein
MTDDNIPATGFSKDFEFGESLNQDNKTPCEPINVPPAEELVNFKIESIPTDPETLKKTSESYFNYLDDHGYSKPCNPEELKNDPNFSALFKQMDKTDANAVEITADMIQTNCKLLKEETAKPTIAKKLVDNFRKLSSTKEFKRKHEISVRVDSEEKEKIELRAKQFGFTNTSDYIRFVTINAVLFAGIDLSKRD